MAHLATPEHDRLGRLLAVGRRRDSQSLPTPYGCPVGQRRSGPAHVDRLEELPEHGAVALDDEVVGPARFHSAR